MDASALAFLEEAEAKDLEVEYMELGRSGFSKSPASERMREVVRRRHVLRQKGRGRKKKEEEEKEARPVVFSTILLWCADTTLWARVPLSLFFVWCAVFPSFVARPEMLGIMASFYQKDCSTLAVVYGSGMCYAGLAGYDTPRVMFPSGVARPRMLCTMAVMDQKDSTLRALVVNHGGGMCWTGSPGDFAPRAVFLSLLLSGPGARHHCRYGADGQLRGEILADMVLMVQTAENCGFSAFAVHQGRRHLLRGSDCDHRDSPVARGYGGRCPLMLVMQISWRGTEADSHGPDFVGPQSFSSCSAR